MYHEIRNELDKVKMSDEMKDRMWKSLCQQECEVKNSLQKPVESHKRSASRWMKAVAVLAICVIAFCGVGGVYYATTGESPVKLISSLFRGHDEDAVQQLGEMYRETEESFVYDGIRYTLEGYSYDRELGYAMAQVKVETEDEEPFLDWDEAYAMAEDDAHAVEICELYASGTEWRNACESGDESYENYGYLLEAYHVFASPYFWGYHSSSYVTLQMESDHAADYFIISEYALNQDGDISEDYVLKMCMEDGTAITEFQLENTGRIPYITASCPEVLGDVKIQITGQGYLMRYEQPEEPDFTLDTLEVILEDGTIYYYDAHEDDWMEKVVAGDGSYGGDTVPDEVVEFWKDKKRMSSTGYMKSMSGNTEYEYYSGIFEDYIDVNDIASVNLNGVPCTLEK